MPKPKARLADALVPDAPACALIDAKIQGLSDRRGETLARLRALIKETDPEVIEEWKWSIPVWVTPRSRLHRRDLQEACEDELRQGRLSARPLGPVQFQP